MTRADFITPLPVSEWVGGGSCAHDLRSFHPSPSLSPSGERSFETASRELAVFIDGASNRKVWIILLTVVAAVLTGCHGALPASDLGTLYTRAASYHGPGRNPIIVIPGILGSKLVEPRSGTVVWGAFGGDYANPQTSDGARLLALPVGQGVALKNLRDSVVSDGALDRLRVDLLGLPIVFNAYAQILEQPASIFSILIGW